MRKLRVLLNVQHPSFFEVFEYEDGAWWFLFTNDNRDYVVRWLAQQATLTATDVEWFQQVFA